MDAPPFPPPLRASFQRHSLSTVTPTQEILLDQGLVMQGNQEDTRDCTMAVRRTGQM